MAKTAEGKKIVRVKPYITKDGKKVNGHGRSTPNTSSGKK